MFQLIKSKLKRRVKDSYGIADKYVNAYARGVKRLLTSLKNTDIDNAVLRGGPTDIIEAFPWYNPNDPESQKLWESFASTITNTTENIFVENTVAKAVEIVEVPESSLKWIRDRNLSMIQEISDATRANLMRILLQSFRRGERVEEIAEKIRNNIGLTERDSIALQRRIDAMEASGTSQDRIDQVARAYAKKAVSRRAEMIARTETIAAQAASRTLSWQQAKAEGRLPEDVVRQWFAGVGSARTCPICIDLDGTQAELDSPFYSNVLGASVFDPPAHPNCRCNVVIVERGQQ